MAMRPEERDDEALAEAYQERMSVEEWAAWQQMGRELAALARAAAGVPAGRRYPYREGDA